MPILLDFQSNPLWLNAGLFVLAAAVVWFSGRRLTIYADAVARRTGIGDAVVGMILLGGITSLPEIAVAATAGSSGHPVLAVNSIFGTVTLQVAVLAIGDAMLRDRAITAVVGSPTVLLQGTFCCILLALPVAGIAVGDVAVLGVGAWTTVTFVGSIGALWLAARYRADEQWRPVHAHKREADTGQQGEAIPMREALAFGAGVTVLIIISGFVLAKSGESLASATGLGDTFVGAILVGGATSLPELSTVVAAVQLRRYLMAFSDMFGTNLFDISLIFVVDLFYAGPPVLDELDQLVILPASMGILITLIFLAGLIEQEGRQLLRMGLDSWLAALVYAGGAAILFVHAIG